LLSGDNGGTGFSSIEEDPSRHLGGLLHIKNIFRISPFSHAAIARTLFNFKVWQTSQEWEKLYAMLALYFAWYNFVRVHSSLRVTPAMESGITDHIWSLQEILA